MRRFILLALVLLVPSPAFGQEASPPPEEIEAPEPYPVAAAAWCAVRSGEDEAPSIEPDADGEPPEAQEDPGAPGCDIGVGAPIYRWRRTSLVAVLGAETVGAGIAWTAYRPERGPILAFALGLVARYDSRGIDGSEFYPAVGATLSFAGRRE